MHISDGILGPQWIFFWYVLSALFTAAGLRIINNCVKKDPAYLPRISLIGAVLFVISVWHIPVPVTGSSSHPVGTPLAAIIVGPFATVVISGIALFFQAFIAHGGLTTLGANVFSMGIVGSFGGYILYRSLKSVFPLWFSAGMAGLVGSILTYLTTALQLALSLNPGQVLAYWRLYALGFIPTQLPLAFAEFAFTGYVISYLARTGSELIDRQNRADIFTRKALFLMLAVTLVIAAGAYLGYQSGGDMVGIDTTVETRAAPGFVPEGIGVNVMGHLGEPLGFALAGTAGGLITGYLWTGFRREQ